MTVSISLREYFAAASSRFTKEDAAVIGPQLETLGQQGITAEEDILAVAQSPNSPLHRFLTWDDRKAAHERRLDQVREMKRSIKVRVIENDRPRVARAIRFVPRAPTAKPPPKGYNALHAESGFAIKMTEAAKADLMAWRARYSPYLVVWAEFARVFQEVANQIDELWEYVDPVGLDHATDAALAALIAWREEHGAVAERWGTMAEQAKFVAEAIVALNQQVDTGAEICP